MTDYQITRAVELDGFTTVCWFPNSWVREGQALATITGAAASGPDTTFTTSAAHGYAVGDNITIAGTASYNGTYTITAVPSNTEFTVAVAFGASETGTSSYYEMYLGTGVVTRLSVDVWDASGADELLVRVFDQTPYRAPGNAYRSASYDSDTGLYLAGGATDIRKPTNGPAVESDVDVYEVTDGTNASPWREGLATIGTPADSDPLLVTTMRLDPNAATEERTLEAECFGGMAIEFVGVATGGALAAVDHIAATCTFAPLSRGDGRYFGATNPSLTQTAPSTL